LRVDSTHDSDACDYYEMVRAGQLDPGRGEVFMMKWRLKIASLAYGPYDSSVGVQSDTGWAAGFCYTEDTVCSAYNADVEVEFAPWEFHDYVMLSPDMRTYSLLIDGTLAFEDQFFDGLLTSRVAWGDALIGGAGIAEWDYLAFGVVRSPEHAGAGVAGVAFRPLLQRRHPGGRLLSRLNTRPARTPVNASPTPLRTPTHDSGPSWAANPSTYDSFIHYTLPVYPGAQEKPAMNRLLCFTIVLALVGVAGAEQYSITYEGNDLPEQEGWDRRWGNDQGAFQGDGAFRTVENGILTMDSLYDLRVYDYAYLELPGQIDPDPGELFVAEWRVMVHEVLGDHYDATLGVSSDSAMQLGFGLFPDHIESVFEDNVSIPVTPDVFHEYRVLSWDMQTYELYIDDELARQGTFWQGALESKLAWGDGVRGAASLSHWDYVRFNVVPEPCSLVLLIGTSVWVGRRRA
ncbi:MAG: hypothetical protein KKB50_21565, partial [Planctomycetes bacterium]|nr:hypothetical protein [Planctomycetota bacterium]